MAEAIYLLCAATGSLSAGLLLRTYRARRTPLLLWSCVAFVGLAVTNILVYADLVLFKAVDLSTAHNLAGAVAMLVLLAGLIWDGDR